MESFRNSAKKKVPPNSPVDMAALAGQMGLARPVHLSTMIKDLNAAAPDFVIYDSGLLGPSTTTGNAQVGITIDGFVSFKGHIHESGFLGHDYVFTMSVFNLLDENGKLVVFQNKGSITGTDQPIGSHRDDNWQQDGRYASIPSRWNSLKAIGGSGASGWKALLHVDTDVAEAFTAFTEALIAAGVIAAAVGTVVLFSGGNAQCQWFTGGSILHCEG